MFKVKGQRSRSQGKKSRSRRKVIYQQQKRYSTGQVRRFQTGHGIVIKAKKGWRGSGGLKLYSQLSRFLVVEFFIQRYKAYERFPCKLAIGFLLFV